MLTLLKKILVKDNIDPLKKYYSSRLETTSSEAEKKAIIYMSSLLNFHSTDKKTGQNNCLIKLNHIAIWCQDIIRMKLFYEYLFCVSKVKKYENKKIGYVSYILTLSDKTEIQLMSMDSIQVPMEDVYTPSIGLAYLAFSVGSGEKVKELTNKLVSDGYELLLDAPPRDDGIPESIILDPEGNQLKIMI